MNKWDWRQDDEETIALKCKVKELECRCEQLQQELLEYVPQLSQINANGVCDAMLTGMDRLIAHLRGQKK